MRNRIYTTTTTLSSTGRKGSKQGSRGYPQIKIGVEIGVVTWRTSRPSPLCRMLRVFDIYWRFDVWHCMRFIVASLRECKSKQK